HTRFSRDWSSDVCSSDLGNQEPAIGQISNTPRAAKSFDQDLCLERSGGFHASHARLSLKGRGIVRIGFFGFHWRVCGIGGRLVEIGRASCRGMVEGWGER